MGYKYEHIGSWWEATAADPTADDNYVYGTYTEFLGTFLSTTAIPSIERLFRGTPNIDKEQWDRVHFQMRALGEIVSDPEPTFTFAHSSFRTFLTSSSRTAASCRPIRIAPSKKGMSIS